MPITPTVGEIETWLYVGLIMGIILCLSHYNTTALTIILDDLGTSWALIMWENVKHGVRQCKAV